MNVSSTTLPILLYKATIAKREGIKKRNSVLKKDNEQKRRRLRAFPSIPVSTRWTRTVAKIQQSMLVKSESPSRHPFISPAARGQHVGKFGEPVSFGGKASGWVSRRSLFQPSVEEMGLDETTSPYSSEPVAKIQESMLVKSKSSSRDPLLSPAARGQHVRKLGEPVRFGGGTSGRVSRRSDFQPSVASVGGMRVDETSSDNNIFSPCRFSAEGSQSKHRKCRERGVGVMPARAHKTYRMLGEEHRHSSSTPAANSEKSLSSQSSQSRLLPSVAVKCSFMDVVPESISGHANSMPSHAPVAAMPTLESSPRRTVDDIFAKIRALKRPAKSESHEIQNTPDDPQILGTDVSSGSSKPGIILSDPNAFHGNKNCNVSSEGFIESEDEVAMRAQQMFDLRRRVMSLRQSKPIQPVVILDKPIPDNPSVSSSSFVEKRHGITGDEDELWQGISSERRERKFSMSNTPRKDRNDPRQRDADSRRVKSFPTRCEESGGLPRRMSGRCDPRMRNAQTTTQAVNKANESPGIGPVRKLDVESELDISEQFPSAIVADGVILTPDDSDATPAATPTSDAEFVIQDSEDKFVLQQSDEEFVLKESDSEEESYIIKDDSNDERDEDALRDFIEQQKSELEVLTADVEELEQYLALAQQAFAEDRQARERDVSLQQEQQEMEYLLRQLEHVVISEEFSCNLKLEDECKGTPQLEVLPFRAQVLQRKNGSCANPHIIHQILHAYLEEDVFCAICMERERNIVLLPCSHFDVCRECIAVSDKCPLCNTKIDVRIPLSIPNHDPLILWNQVLKSSRCVPQVIIRNSDHCGRPLNDESSPVDQTVNLI